MPDFNNLSVTGDITVNGNLILTNPHSIASHGHSKAYGDNRNTTATTWADIPDRTITYTVKKPNATLLVSLDDSFGNAQSSNAPGMVIRLLMDGTVQGHVKPSHCAGNYGWRIWSCQTAWIVSGVSAGSHTFKVQWYKDSGAGEILAGWSTQHNFMLVRELY